MAYKLLFFEIYIIAYNYIIIIVIAMNTCD